MGRIKTKEIKKMSFSLKDKYPNDFTDDFEKNKQFLRGLNLVEDKKVRNKIAGYVTKISKISKN